MTSALERIVRHCLEKEPAARFQNARDLIFDLESLPRESARRRRAAATSRLAERVTLAVASLLGVSQSPPLLGYLAGTRLGTGRRHRRRAVTASAG